MTSNERRKIVEDHAHILARIPFQVTADIYDGRFTLALIFLRTYAPNTEGSRALQDELEKEITK